MSKEEILREIEEWRMILEKHEAIRLPSVTDRYMMIVAREKIEELKKKIKEFIHYTVVGNMDTETDFARIVASCILDYDVIITEVKKYYEKAVTKIRDWVADMFNAHDVEFSSETSVTSKEVEDLMIEAEVDVTDLMYYWYWFRVGRTKNEESKHGVISWEEGVPLGVAGGWMTTGKKKKEVR